MMLHHIVDKSPGSVNHSGSAALTTDAETEPCRQPETAASQAMMLGTCLEKKLEEGTASTRTQCPTLVSSPDSGLPFQTAQANSVLSIAQSGNNSRSLADGGVLASSTQVATGSEKGAVSTESNLRLGLDLGNGWKVVGLTSLSDLAAQVSAQAQQVPIPTASMFGTELTPAGSGTDSTGTDGGGGLSGSGCTLDAASLSGEWKVVGLTSLNPDCTTTPRDQESSISVHNVDTSDGRAVSSDTDNSPSVQSQNPLPSDPAKTMQKDPPLPSLADLAKGTSDWKIAGITTLPFSVSPSASSGCRSAASDLLDPAETPDTAASASTDVAKWKVVGVTSLSSTVPNPSLVVASPLTPIPVVMAAGSPLVSLPTPPASAEGGVEWKVVGVVPLPQNGDVVPDSSGPQTASKLHNCGPAAGPESKVQGNNLESEVEHETGYSLQESPSKRIMHTTEESHHLTQSGKSGSQPSPGIPKDSGHPLAFLKNCSKQLRNAVLKKNTVSTMLELKRALHSTDAEDKLMTVLGGRNLFSVKKQEDQNAMFCGASHTSNSVTQVDDEFQQSGMSHVFPSSHDLTQRRTAVLNAHSGSSEQLSTNQMMESLETDDRLALSNAYRAQMVFKEEVIPDSSNNFCMSHFYSSSQNSAQDCVPSEISQTSSCVKMIKTEDGQSMMSLSGFVSDSVNLTNVDPWGVCTDEDLGEIAEMMSEKGENRIFHSSSRKRKLTTPRKMVL